MKTVVDVTNCHFSLKRGLQLWHWLHLWADSIAGAGSTLELAPALALMASVKPRFWFQKKLESPHPYFHPEWSPCTWLRTWNGNYLHLDRQRLKYLLYWNEAYGSTEYGFCCGQQPFLEKDCPTKNCFATNNRWLFWTNYYIFICPK